MQTKTNVKLLRKREAAEVLSVSLRKLDSMLTSRELTPYKFGRCVRISESELQAKIAEAAAK